jgi:hypothetical protein
MLFLVCKVISLSGRVKLLEQKQETSLIYSRSSKSAERQSLTDLETSPTESAAKPSRTSTPMTVEPPPVGVWPANEKINANSPTPSTRGLASTWHSLESTIGNRWGLWFGGFILLLSAGFFVREAVVNGWVGPTVRVLTLFVLAIGALYLGRSKLLDRLGEPLNMSWSQLRPVLNAVGVSFLYASVFAAGPHYGLIGETSFTLLMLAISMFALITSMTYGVPVAAIGLLGGFLLPYLTGYHSEQVNGFLIYLWSLFITADLSGRFSKRDWQPLAAACLLTISGGLAAGISDGAAMLFLAAVLYSLWPLIFMTVKTQKNSTTQPVLPSFLPYCQMAVLILPLLIGVIYDQTDGYWVCGFAIITPVLLYNARCNAQIFYLAPLLAVFDLAFLACWPGLPKEGFTIDTAFQTNHLLILTFVITAAFTLPLVRVSRTEKTDQWLILQAVMTFAIAAILQVRIGIPLFVGYHVTYLTPIYALLPAVYYIGSTTLVDPWFPGRTNQSRLIQRIIAFLAALVTISSSTGPYDVANTTIFFVLIVLVNADPANGFYRYMRFPLYLVGLVCVMADLTYVLVDLGIMLINPAILGYHEICRYMILPLILLALTSLQLRHHPFGTIEGKFEDADIYSLAASMLLLLTIGAGIIVTDSPMQFSPNQTYWVPDSFMLACLAVSLTMWAFKDFLHRGRSNDFVRLDSISGLIARWGYSGLTCGAAILVLFTNPILLDQRIAGGSTLILLVQYLLPIGVIVSLWRFLPSHLPSGWWPLTQKILIGYMTTAGFIWLSTEVYEVLNGKNDPLIFDNTEIWALSIVWTLYGVGMIMIGFLRKLDLLRYAGIAVIGLTSLKVLFIDTSSLSGMARVASLFFLGVALIGVGILYQKYTKTVDGLKTT